MTPMCVGKSLIIKYFFARLNFYNVIIKLKVRNLHTLCDLCKLRFLKTDAIVSLLRYFVYRPMPIRFLFLKLISVLI